jgi:hypothetical protein
MLLLSISWRLGTLWSAILSNENPESHRPSLLQHHPKKHEISWQLNSLIISFSTSPAPSHTWHNTPTPSFHEPAILDTISHRKKDYILVSSIHTKKPRPVGTRQPCTPAAGRLPYLSAPAFVQSYSFAAQISAPARLIFRRREKYTLTSIVAGWLPAMRYRGTTRRSKASCTTA